MFRLTEDERELLKAQHRLERDGRVRDRIKAVLLRDRGWSYKKIADALLLSDDGVRNHIREYLEFCKLKPENGGSKERLSFQQSELLQKHLEEHTYLHAKSIVHYIKFRWNISYTIAGLTHWLKRNRFSYKKPKLVPGKADKEQQQIWINSYQELKTSLPEDETICFMDGVHPSHNVQLGHGWIRRGFEKLIPSNTGRSRLNLTGAIDIISHKVVVQEDTMLNAEATINFLKKLELCFLDKCRVHVFCDNARYYRNKKVRAYLESSRIQLHFLPPYSPNLNPIERLWKWMKETVVYNTYYEDFYEFKSAVFGFFKSISGLDPGSELGCSFRKRIRDKFRALSSPIQTTN